MKLTKTKYTRKLTITLNLLLGLLMLNTAVSAKGIYKCVKPNGDVEYTQKASKGCDAQQIKKQGGSADKKAIEKLQQDGKWSKIADEEKRQAALEKQDEKRAKQENLQYCEELKANLEQISNSNRVFEEGSNGERVKLTEEQRQQKIQENKQSMDTHCSP